MSSTLTLQQSVNFASMFTRLNPLSNVAGIAGEPALTIGNWVRQMILGPPFAWRWNRSQTAFLATIGQQDYNLTSFQASTLVFVGQILLDSNGNQQAVTVAGTTAASAPTWNATPGGTTVSGTATFVNQGSIDSTGTVASLASFGWLEKAVAIDGAGNSHELTLQLNVSKNGTQNQPFIISPVIDSNTGSIIFRIQPPPEQPYTVYLTFQRSAGNFTSLTDPWTPIPDYFSYLYNQGFLAKSYEYLDNERYGAATQMFVKFLVAANEGLSESQINIFLPERMNTARMQADTLGTAQSARAGRSLG